MTLQGFIFIIVITILLVIIFWRRKGVLDPIKGPRHINRFIKWLNEIHGNQKYRLKITDANASCNSEKFKIKYNFSTKRGTLYNKSTKQAYKIIFIDDKFSTLAK